MPHLAQPGHGLRPVVLLVLLLASAHGQIARSTLVYPGPDGRLIYVADERGDTIPDFSNCGYGGGGVALPEPPVCQRLQPAAEQDDGPRLQAALDAVAALPATADGWRGAVLLQRGTYRIAGTLALASGVVLRGEGSGDDGTRLVATGQAKRPLIAIHGGAPKEAGARAPILDERVPVGARRVRVADGAAFRVGQQVVVVRQGNAAWIHEIGMDRITPNPDDPASTVQWKPFVLRSDRVITAIEENLLTLDAPLACAIEQRWGGGYVAAWDDSARLNQVGVEHLQAVSEYDPTVVKTYRGQRYEADEEHAEYLVSVRAAKNAFLRDLVASHFAHGMVHLTAGSKWVTVEDCASLAPVSQIQGGRRYPFHIDGGELCLVQRSRSEQGRHCFVFGARMAGPNVFLECVSSNPYSSSEPHHRWSTGGLYNNVEANLAIQDRQHLGTGHGWAGANFVVWNCSGSLVIQQPPTAQNWAMGFVGKKGKPAFPRPEGWIESFGQRVEPASLYRQQLADRLAPRP